MIFTCIVFSELSRKYLEHRFCNSIVFRGTGFCLDVGLSMSNIIKLVHFLKYRKQKKSISLSIAVMAHCSHLDDASVTVATATNGWSPPVISLLSAPKHPSYSSVQTNLSNTLPRCHLRSVTAFIVLLFLVWQNMTVKRAYLKEHNKNPPASSGSGDLCSHLICQKSSKKNLTYQRNDINTSDHHHTH